MEIGIALEVDIEVERLSSTVTRLEDQLNAFFSEKEYGQGVSSIYIGLILMGGGSERMHPARPFKYQKLYKFRSRITGERTEIPEVVMLDLKPDFDTLKRLNSEEAGSYIAEALIKAMDVISSHQKKFPMFDTAKFTEDFAMCLRRAASLPGPPVGFPAGETG